MEVFVMTNKEKITKDQKNKEHNFMEILIISLLIVSFLGLILFSKKELQGWGEGIFCSEVFGE